jgi:hypothetical protein
MAILSHGGSPAGKVSLTAHSMGKQGLGGRHLLPTTHYPLPQPPFDSWKLLINPSAINDPPFIPPFLLGLQVQVQCSAAQCGVVVRAVQARLPRDLRNGKASFAAPLA